MASGVSILPRVLLVGYDPDTVDFSNPALPPGMNADKIRDGLELTLKEMTSRGWEGALCLIRPDHMAVKTLERHLASRKLCLRRSRCWLCPHFRRLVTAGAGVGHRESEFFAIPAATGGVFSERDFAGGFLCK